MESQLGWTLLSRHALRRAETQLRSGLRQHGAHCQYNDIYDLHASVDNNMSTTSVEKQFREAFLSELERSREDATARIRQILETEPPPEIRILVFEIFSHWDSFPMNVFAMDDKSEDEVYFKRPFSGPVVKSQRRLIRDKALDQEYFEDAGIDTFKAGSHLLAEWFADLWKKSGGRKFSRPAYVGAHDSGEAYDLKKGRWYPLSEIWP